MGTIAEHQRFSLFNTDGRNNKFWNITLYTDGSVEVHFGPQGMAGQKRIYPVGHPKAGKAGYDKQIRDKTKASHEGGAYTENEVVEAVQTASSGKTVAKSELARKAIADIAKNQHPELTALIHYFADVNAHNLYEASGGKITYDASAGTFSTTQGVVTLAQVQRARTLLNSIADFADAGDFASDGFKAAINPYLSLIPQKGLVRQMDFCDMFSPNRGLVRQNDVLDALESSYAAVLAASKDKKDTPVQQEQEEALFQVDLQPTEDVEVDRVRTFYRQSKGHHSDVQHYDVRRVFRLSIRHMSRAFFEKSAKMPNTWELWHGTKASNMLSILKVGMIVPPKSSPHVTGRMYGDGLYFSDQSTKSIRYATGAWGGGGAKDRKFMLLVRVAMGNYYVPKGGCQTVPKGYDSCFAKAGQSGVSNNEMIVYSGSQADPVFLIEFTPQGK